MLAKTFFSLIRVGYYALIYGKVIRLTNAIVTGHRIMRGTVFPLFCLMAFIAILTILLKV